MSKWSIIVPEAGTNLVIDPSCTALDIYNALSSTVTVDTTYARFGYMALKCVTSNATDNEGIQTDTGTNGIAVTKNASYTFSVYLRGSGTVFLEISWYNSSGTLIGYSTGTAFALSNTGWTRYTLTGTAGTSTATGFASLEVLTEAKGTNTFYADGYQFEANAYATTFISGTQPGCKWNGLYNASTSTRDAQERSGGRLRDIEDTYGWRVLEYAGAGMPPLINNVQSLALQPGAQFVSTTITPRQLILQSEYHAGTLATFHGKRQDIIDIIKPDAVRGAQPFIICYTGGARPLYASFRYDDGMQINAYSAGVNYVEKPTIGLLAVDPFWYEDDQQIAALDFTDSLTADYAFARINGKWQKLGSGFNGTVNAIAIDYGRGRVYFGGAFTTANGVTVNRICYWNGTTFVPISVTASGNGIQDGIVYALAIAPTGDIWAGGTFTELGITKGLMRITAASYYVFNTATTFTSIDSIAITSAYRVYIGGAFASYDGATASKSYIIYTDDLGSTWNALTATAATGGTPKVDVVTLDTNKTSIYFGGDFTAIGGVSGTARVAKYNGTAITALSTGFANGIVECFAVAPNGDLYIGGTFTSPANYLAKWNGNVLTNLSESYNVWGLAFDGKSNALLETAGATRAVRRYVNGSVVSDYDLLLDSYPANKSPIAVDEKTGDVYVCLGGQNSGTSSAATTSGQAIFSNLSSSITYPSIYISGPTSGSCTLVWLENQTTQQAQYYNLVIQSGETITIDLSPLKKTVTSNWRGTIYDQPLSNSDFANWQLLPGSNTIAAFITGTTTGVNMIMSWKPVHWGVDGTS